MPYVLSAVRGEPTDLLTHKASKYQSKLREPHRAKTMMNPCKLCEGKGYILVPNGEDDFDKEYCDCSAGMRLQDSMEEEVRNEAWRLAAHNN